MGARAFSQGPRKVCCLALRTPRLSTARLGSACEVPLRPLKYLARVTASARSAFPLQISSGNMSRCGSREHCCTYTVAGGAIVPKQCHWAVRRGRARERTAEEKAAAAAAKEREKQQRKDARERARQEKAAEK